MSLLSWLDGWTPRVREFSDTFMPNRLQLNRELIRWLPDRQRHAATLLLAHFPETFSRLQDQLEDSQIPYQLSTTAVTPVDVVGLLHDPLPTTRDVPALEWATNPLHTTDDVAGPSRSCVLLALVSQLKWDAARTGRRDATNRHASVASAANSGFVRSSEETAAGLRRLAVMTAERHFLRRCDRQVVEFVRQLGCRAEVGFFVALDDPLIAADCSPALLQLLDQYGMTPDRPVQSYLLDRVLQRCQRRFARQVVQEQPADSPGQWLQRNTPALS